jgi:hypothetical protein
MMTARGYGDGLLLGLCWLLSSLTASAGETEQVDHERPLVQQGVLGTVNVLRELNVKAWTNRVTVTSNAGGRDSKPEDTVDGSGKIFRPNLDPSKPFVLTYSLPGLRTVSSLVIAYEYAPNDAPTAVRLEGSSDGGQTWFEVFRSKPRKTEFLKCFKPVKVNMLRLTQEGDGTDKCCRRTKEVFVYADPEAPLPVFGSKDSGAFSFLRGLWYAGKIKLSQSPSNGTWAAPFGGLPHVPFMSNMVGFHSAMCFGEGQKGGGSRLYARLDLDRAYPMDYGLISNDGGGHMLAAESRAELYTANGNLDPSRLQGNSIKDLTGQGWILQNAWDRDSNLCKSFFLERPGTYNQILVVWDYYKVMENNRWSHLEMFGMERPDGGGAARNLQK